MEKKLAGGQNCPLSANIHRIISCPGGMQEIRKITIRQQKDFREDEGLLTSTLYFSEW